MSAPANTRNKGRRRGDPARRTAFDALRAVNADGAYANLVLPALLRERGLSGRDAAFATELLAGTCRWQGSYDMIPAGGVGSAATRGAPDSFHASASESRRGGIGGSGCGDGG